jgi:hypothetical protein
MQAVEAGDVRAQQAAIKLRPSDAVLGGELPRRLAQRGGQQSAFRRPLRIAGPAKERCYVAAERIDLVDLRLDDALDPMARLEIVNSNAAISLNDRNIFVVDQLNLLRMISNARRVSGS